MIYVVRMELTGVLGPAGFVSYEEEEARAMARVWLAEALSHLGDHAASADWFDLAGNSVELAALIHSDDQDEQGHLLEQTNDLLVAKGMGQLLISEYETLDDLIASERISEWCSGAVRSALDQWRQKEREVIRALNEDWQVA